MAVAPIGEPDGAPRLEDLSGSSVGRFMVLRRLGQGGMGEVYLAEDTALHRRVALKRIPPRLRSNPRQAQQFRAEAERASQLNSPFIACVYDILQTPTDIFIVMEYVEGETLRNRLKQQRFSISEFLQVAIQCCEALKAAHAQGIIHCDIKPENIMLTPEGGVKVLDFGIARRLPSEDYATAPTVTLETSLHSFSGTPAYMAPELLLEKPPDVRSDLFSFGVVLYEVLTGVNPFVADTVIATAERVLRDKPQSPSKLNAKVMPELNAIVMRLIAKKPADRYSTATELIGHLLPLQVARQAEANAARSRFRSWRLATVVAIAAVIVAAAALLVAYKPKLSSVYTAAVTAPQKQLAILPFATPDANNRAFCDGLTETLTAKLSQVSDRYPFAVIPPQEIRSEGITTVEEARKSMGVDLIITGTLRQSGDKVRITYSVLDAVSHRQLRGDSITSELSNPFAVEDRVVDSVLDSLQIALQPEERQALAFRGTTEPRAYDYYLQGIGYLQDYHKPENVESAATVFRRALERDPNYALAWAGIGQAYWYKYDSSRDSNWARRAQDACEQAVEIDAAAAGAHVCLGTVYNGTGRPELAAQEFQHAVDIEPSSEEARLGLASAFESLNRLDDAEAAYRRGIALRPNYWGGYNRLGVFYFNHARYPEALEMFQKVVALAPDNFRGYSNLGGIYVALDDYAKAVPMLERSVAIRPGSDSYSNLATAYFYQHRFVDAVHMYEQAVKLDPKQYMPWGNLGEAYYWTPGRRADASNAYRKAIQLGREQLAVNARDTAILSDVALYEAMTNQRELARADLDKALSAHKPDSDVLFKAAIISKQFGNSAQALAYLQRCVAAGYSPNRIRDNPIFDDLASDQRFQALTRK